MKGAVLVSRKDEKSRRESFDKMKGELKKDIHICIYPEGTRNRTKEPLKQFYDGAFRLAHATKKSIIPAVILNTKKVLPIDKTFYFWPHRIEMHFLEPIPTGEKTAAELKEIVFNRMKEYYLSNKT
jgi:1-acyl-sn-glycerol-3-phosphate acyltransferase